MNLTGFHHVAIICSDYTRSKAFYVDLLGFTILEETYRSERDSYKLDLGLPDGNRIELFSMPGAPPRASYPEAQGLRHLAFATPDIEGVAAELKQMGIAVEDLRVDSLTGKRFAFFADPDGLPLELYEFG